MNNKTDIEEDIKEAISIYNKLFQNTKIRAFEKARSLLLEEMKNRRPEVEYYKSSILYDYYILKPYASIEFCKSGIIEQQRDFDCIAKGRKDKSELHFCLSLCKMNRNEIIEVIENHIKKDNKKYLKESLETKE